jgi:hypothetical protein
VVGVDNEFSRVRFLAIGDRGDFELAVLEEERTPLMRTLAVNAVREAEQLRFLSAIVAGPDIL